jgi:hypothetical protein
VTGGLRSFVRFPEENGRLGMRELLLAGKAARASINRSSLSRQGRFDRLPCVPRAFLERDLEILGYSELREERFEGWTIFSGVALAGLERVETAFLYLNAGFTNEMAKEAKPEFVGRKGRKYVIVPRSEERRKNFIDELFGSYSKFFVAEDLIWAKIQERFAEYLQHIRKIVPQEEHYVAPRKEGPYEPDARLDDELLQLLTYNGDKENRRINVVRAAAGVGKTTLARRLARMLADKSDSLRVVPVQVESSHWDKLQLASLEGLWEIIENSFHKCSHNLQINKSLFEHLLRQGDLAFIFDGFDELCERRHSCFTPRNVLDELLALATETSKEHSTSVVTNIVITTRTMYWKAAVGSTKLPFRVLDLAPFNRHQAHSYFQNVFKKTPRDHNKAQGIYRKLVRSNTPLTPGGPREQFVNHPFCLQMIAEGVRRGYDEQFEFSGPTSLLLQFLLQFCERERRRQRLITPAESQLDALQEIAVAGEFDAFELDYCVAAGFEEKDLPRLIDHPLLNAKVVAEKTLYSFKYEFLRPFLKAKFLVAAIRRIGAAGATKDDPAWRVMAEESGANGSVLEHVLQLIVPNDTKAVTGCYRTALRVLPKKGPELSFLFHVARLLVERPNLTKRERTDLLFGLLFDKFNQSREVHRLYVVGQINKLDLSDVKFIECDFVDVSFRDCIANKGTQFRQSLFTGDFDVAGTDQKSWSHVKVSIDCILDFPTNLIWERVLRAEVGAKEEHLRDALGLALAKFWHHGQPKLTLPKNQWSTGTLGHSIYCEPIRNAMFKYGLTKEATMGGEAEPVYLFSDDAIPDLQRFMDNGQLTGRIRDVFDSLLTK